jgi:hypothetical protein
MAGPEKVLQILAELEPPVLASNAIGHHLRASEGCLILS